jgi:heterodisulfide reductase subunit B
MATDADIALRANNYLGLETPYGGETQVLHFLEVLRDRVGFDKIREKVVNPLTGRKIAAYYGCLLLRPGKVMRFDDPENPRILEDFIRALGAEPVTWALRNECCGAYVTVEDKAQAEKRSNRVMENAAVNGADTVITACPLCLYNLKKNGGHDDLPVVYFTELLAEALGVK